jgi:cytochrome c-type biogenesis protein CcmH
MALWLGFALMTAAAIMAVLWPLSRRKPVRDGSDVAVYRDQLDEIGRDRAAGLIGEAEAEAARVEVSRRLLAAADAAAAAKPVSETSSLFARRVTAIVGLVLLPVGAVLLYLALGSPQLPGEPLASRSEAAHGSDMAKLIAQVENHLASNPNDGRAWEVLAPVYISLGRYDDAVKAWRNAIRLNGSTAVREAEYGQALVAAANGTVTAEAKAVFEKALSLDKEDVMARFFMAMAADQEGRPADADKMWGDMIASAPPGAPWIETVRRAMRREAPQAPGAQAQSGQPAPEHSGDMDAMVARLAERLKKDGSNAEGWAQLVRSYRALGQNDKAEAATADARQALAGDAGKLQQFNSGITGASAAASASPPALAPLTPLMPSAPAAAPAGPSAADMAAVQQLKPDEQNEMIRGMVTRLADRLKQDGSDLEGWQRLLRAYLVLGDKAKASAAAADARKALASDPDKLKRLDELIKAMGIGS